MLLLGARGAAVNVAVKSVASATLVSLFVFLALGLFVHPGLLFLLAIPAGPIAFAALSRREASPRALPSAICPSCAGEWSAWGRINRHGNYQTIDDYSTHYTQSRSCKECGYAESRRVA